MAVVIVANLTRTADGKRPLPRLIGPFPTENTAERFLKEQGRLWGTYDVEAVTHPDHVTRN